MPNLNNRFSKIASSVDPQFGAVDSNHSKENSKFQPRYQQPTGSILRCALAAKKIGISRSSLYEKLRPASRYFDATFPRPIRLGMRSVGWFSHELDQWLLAQSDKVKGATQ